MSEALNNNVDRKEISSLQMNQERWKVISGGAVSDKTKVILGGEEQVGLIKSGWEKQKTSSGFDKTGEELAALGGAVNVIKLERLSGYAEETNQVEQKETGIVDPEKPTISERNQVVFKVVNGTEWEGLNDGEKQLLGDEGDIELARSAWEKQSEKNGTGAMKTAEELMALTGRRGAAGIDDLVADMNKMSEYDDQVRENANKLNELFDEKKRLEEKYVLTDEEKLILNPLVEVEEMTDDKNELSISKSNEPKEPEMNPNSPDEENPDDKGWIGQKNIGGKGENDLDDGSDLPKDDKDGGTELDDGGSELPKDDKSGPELDDGGSGGDVEKDKGFGDGVIVDGDKGDAVRNGELFTHDGSVDKDEFDWYKFTPKLPDNPSPGAGTPPHQEESTGDRSKAIIVNPERNAKLREEKEGGEKKTGLWDRFKRFFTEATYNEPTIITRDKMAKTLFGRIANAANIFNNSGNERVRAERSFHSLEDLAKAQEDGSLYDGLTVEQLLHQEDRLMIQAQADLNKLEDKSGQIKVEAKRKMLGIMEAIDRL